MAIRSCGCSCGKDGAAEAPPAPGRNVPAEAAPTVSEWGHTTLHMRTTSLPARLASRGGLPLAPSRGDSTFSGSSFATKERDALPVMAFDHSVGEWPPQVRGVSEEIDIFSLALTTVFAS